MADEPPYELVLYIGYEAKDDDSAALLAAELAAAPLAHDAVWSSEGDFYHAGHSTPLNKRTLPEVGS